MHAEREVPHTPGRAVRRPSARSHLSSLGHGRAALFSPTETAQVAERVQPVPSPAATRCGYVCLKTHCKYEQITDHYHGVLKNWSEGVQGFILMHLSLYVIAPVVTTCTGNYMLDASQ